MTLVVTGMLAQTGNRRLDYGEACKHGIGGWIMVKPSKQGIGGWIIVKAGKQVIGGWIMVNPANTK